MEKLVSCTFMNFVITIVRFNCVFVHKALGIFLFSYDSKENMDSGFLIQTASNETGPYARLIILKGSIKRAAVLCHVASISQPLACGQLEKLVK